MPNFDYVVLVDECDGPISGFVLVCYGFSWGEEMLKHSLDALAKPAVEPFEYEAIGIAS